MVNLAPLYKEGLDNLQRWKTRYDESEYYEKVVINIFYRRWAMKRMWSEIMQYADKRKGSKSYEQAMRELGNLYRDTTLDINPILEEYLENHPAEDMGGASYGYYKEIAEHASFLPQAAYSLETSYLFYLISDQLTLIWAAIAASGMDKLKAVTEITGRVIAPMPLNDYTTVSQGLGQLMVSDYVQQHYRL